MKLLKVLWLMPKSYTSWTVGGAAFLTSLADPYVWGAICKLLPDQAGNVEGHAFVLAFMAAVFTPVISRVVTYLRAKDKFFRDPEPYSLPEPDFLDPEPFPLSGEIKEGANSSCNTKGDRHEIPDHCPAMPRPHGLHDHQTH